MFIQAHCQRMLDHYVKMASSGQAWKEYAWQRVNELARANPAMHADLPAKLTAAMQEAANAISSQ